MNKKLTLFLLLTGPLACEGNMGRGVDSSRAHSVSPVVSPSAAPSSIGDANSSADANTSVPMQSCVGRADGTACSDGNACHIGASCLSGACQGAASLPGPCSTSIAAIPLKGTAYHLYTVPVLIGNSGPFDLVLDTGSPSVAVAGANCANCNDRAPTYTPGPGASSSGASTSITYGCGIGFQGEKATGWAGQILTDSVALASTATTAQHAATFQVASIDDGDPAGSAIPMFVCLDNGQANSGQGIIGFTTGNYHGLDSYVDAAKLNAFTLQVCDAGGRLWLDAYDPNYLTAPPQFTPLLATNVYTLTLLDLQIGGKSVVTSPSDFGQTIIDSGTTRLTLPAEPFAGLLDALKTDGHMDTLFGANFLTGSTCSAANPPMTRSQLDALLPKLNLTFPGTEGRPSFTVELPATESYLTPDMDATAAAAVFCPGVEQETEADFSNTTLLGNVLTHTNLTIYDIQNMRLGFAPQAHCDTAAP